MFLLDVINPIGIAISAAVPVIAIAALVLIVVLIVKNVKKK